MVSELASKPSTASKKLKSFKGRSRREAVSQQDLELQNLQQGIRLSPMADYPNAPLLIEKTAPEFDLTAWLTQHENYWRPLLYKHAALVFRGFGIDNVHSMESFAGATLKSIYKDNTEHRPITKSGDVQIPVEYAHDQKLLWHNENTFNLHWPQRAIFACAVPAASGGETPLSDSRAIYQQMPTEIREAFQQKGVMYVRKYGVDDLVGLSWKKIFNTEDPKVAEQKCQEQDMQFEWRDDGSLVTRQIRPGVYQHPETGEWSWLNQAQHWHFSCLDSNTQKAISALFDEPNYPRNCYFGDGSPIPNEWMQTILQLYQDNEIAFPWQQGDAALVDNILAAHARNAYSGERRIMVCFGDMAYFERNN